MVYAIVFLSFCLIGSIWCVIDVSVNNAKLREQIELFKNENKSLRIDNSFARISLKNEKELRKSK